MALIFFLDDPLIDRVVIYLRSGMTACLCWHTLYYGQSDSLVHSWS